MILDYRERKEFRDYLEERRLQRRLLVVRAAVVGAFALLLAFFWYLQVARGEEFARLAEENRLRREVVPPLRGRILDRQGRPLASNRPGFNVYWNREEVTDAEATLARLGELLGVRPATLRLRLERAARRPAFLPVLVSEGESFARASAVEARRLELSGIRVQQEAIRHYDEGPLAAHAVGYLREASEAELGQDPEVLAPGDLVGKTGIERSHDATLRGSKGLYLWVVDSHGRRLAVDRRLEEPRHGRDLVLSLDLDAQRALVEALDERPGAGVFLDPRDGSILALASSPYFDPNLFSGRISREDWSRLSGDPRHPLQNRALRAKYPPGSTFKIVVAIAALEEAAVTPQTTVWCPGWANFYGRAYRCWKGGGHGRVDLHRALRESCNVYFYTVGKSLGIETLSRWAGELGLGRPTGVDLGRDLSGTVPSGEWKLRRFGQPWYPGETISVSIGQGYLEVTPLQMARLAAAVANGGRLPRPTLAGGGGGGEETPRAAAGPATLRRVREGMTAAVNERGGTGARARLPGVQVAGKTGTVQVVGLDRGGEDAPEDHSWFVGFAPAEEPRVAFAVIVEHGGHGGSRAAPVTRAVLETLFRDGVGEAPSPPDRVARAALGG